MKNSDHSAQQMEVQNKCLFGQERILKQIHHLITNTNRKLTKLKRGI